MKFVFELHVEITDKDIDDIMCAALEGGINYWCDRVEVNGKYLGEYASEQLSRGGTLLFREEETGKFHKLDRQGLIEGMKTAAKNGYATEWLKGDRLDIYEIDAAAADIIVQFALFNEIVYG